MSKSNEQPKISRRFFTFSGASAAGLALAGCGQEAPKKHHVPRALWEDLKLTEEEKKMVNEYLKYAIGKEYGPVDKCLLTAMGGALADNYTRFVLHYHNRGTNVNWLQDSVTNELIRRRDLIIKSEEFKKAFVNEVLTKVPADTNYKLREILSFIWHKKNVHRYNFSKDFDFSKEEMEKHKRYEQDKVAAVSSQIKLTDWKKISEELFGEIYKTWNPKISVWYNAGQKNGVTFAHRLY